MVYWVEKRETKAATDEQIHRIRVVGDPLKDIFGDTEGCVEALIARIEYEQAVKGELQRILKEGASTAHALKIAAVVRAAGDLLAASRNVIQPLLENYPEWETADDRLNQALAALESTGGTKEGESRSTLPPVPHGLEL